MTHTRENNIHVSPINGETQRGGDRWQNSSENKRKRLIENLNPVDVIKNWKNVSGDLMTIMVKRGSSRRERHEIQWNAARGRISQWWTDVSIVEKRAESLRGLNEGKKQNTSPLTHTHTHTGRAISENVPYTQALPLQSSMIVLDMVPSLMLTDAHLLGSSHLFIYLFICVKFIYWWASRMWWHSPFAHIGK